MESGRFDTKSFRYKSIRYKQKLFRYMSIKSRFGTVEVDSIQTTGRIEKNNECVKLLK